MQSTKEKNSAINQTSVDFKTLVDVGRQNSLFVKNNDGFSMNEFRSHFEKFKNTIAKTCIISSRTKKKHLKKLN